MEQTEEAPVKRGIFEKDLPGMMYGFGDGPKPRQETVDLVEDMVIEYVSALLERAVDMASYRGRLKFEDFVWQEPSKLERLKELLEKNEEIKKARKMDLDKRDLAALGSREKDNKDATANGNP